MSSSNQVGRGGQLVKFEANLPLFDQMIPLKVEVPDGPMRLSDLIPFAWSICDQVVSVAQAYAEANGQLVSCRKGCSACCGSYLPGMSEPEAFRLVEDIQHLPDEPRQRILSGFVELGEAAEASGMYEEVREKCGGTIETEEGARILQDWWAQARRDCPMLKNGVCSMHPQRPTVCREFLAVSPSELCATCQAEKVHIPVNMYHVLGRVAAELRADGSRPTTIIFPTLLKWYGARKDLGPRAWRAPAMIESFLGILVETAGKSPALDGMARIAHLLSGPVSASR